MRDLLVNLTFLQLMYVVEYVWCKTVRSRSSVLLHVIIVDETILYTAAKYNDFQMPILTDVGIFLHEDFFPSILGDRIQTYN